MASFCLHIKTPLGETRKMVYSNVRDAEHAKSVLALHQRLDVEHPQFDSSGDPIWRTPPGEVVEVEHLTGPVQRPLEMTNG